MKNGLRTPEELKDSFDHLRLMFAIQEYVVNTMVMDLTKEDFQKLSEEQEIILPITDLDIIAKLKLCDNITDFTSLFMSLSELGSEFRIAFDINPNEEWVDKDELETLAPFLLSIYAFIEKDKNPDGGGDDDDDDQPVGEKKEVLKTNAVAAGGGR